MPMNKILLFAMTTMLFASCANTYNIEGSSNVSMLDGRMLYLKMLKNNEMKNIDSCDVVHGQFKFCGTFDSVGIATIYMDDESLIPVVLEKGDITVSINNTQQIVSGTPLNDELFKFFNKYNQINSQKAELLHTHDRAIMDGKDMDEVNAKLELEAGRLSQEEDKLVTSFVTDNFDNVLGPGVFLMVTSSYRYPELTPWIEDIMSKATEKFKNDAYVKDYYQKAQENQAIMNGMKEVPAQVPSAPQAMPSTPQNGYADNAPTPNDLAKPVEKQ